ncbi:DUF1405 domain-containing protein [Halalkalibacterium halodurans]|uniref:DUF1405 domain-containing protein n=1 Tax=Halalkalibacterium halodurans TaxID=86665 RepID=UPI002AA9AFA3|nr:DUF1405 domain-containing protein [Halalkalibacterium halodurans]MDY7222246.1 DUF1405 domain-containing protein [Halalkalibacterium halodurans]MDY7241467.1 DUF1405 domain-containing protein [Halalkalibacterium halodurans]
MWIKHHLFSFLVRKDILWALLVINFLGTIYGYIWYTDQLAQTPAHFLIFVPDSPTASLFFVFVLIAFLQRKNWSLFEAFAAVTLIKYGIWAVAMILAGAAAGDTLNWQHYMLIFSHGGMAIQAYLYMSFYRIRLWHLLVVSSWTLLNDYIDYAHLMHPWVSRRLNDYVIPEIAMFTVGLSLFSILSVYFLSVRGKAAKRSLE